MAKRLGLVDKPHLQRFKNNLDKLLAEKVNYTDYATDSKFGLVKPDNTTITIENGVISGKGSYKLPMASTVTLGGVKVDGQTIKVSANGVISSSSKGGVDYLEEEQLVGIKWISGDEIYQTTILLENPINCVANQWNEVCEITDRSQILVDCFVSNNNNFVSHPETKLEGNKIYIYPIMNYSIDTINVQYTKTSIPEFMSDTNWDIVNQWTYEELQDTKWKH